MKRVARGPVEPDMSEALNELGEHVRNALPEDVLSAAVGLGELVIAVHRGSIVKVLTFLRDDANCQFRLLVDVCGVDYPERESRFEVLSNVRFLKPGAFDAQNIVTIPTAKLIRRLGTLPADQMAAVEAAVRRWLGLGSDP